MHIEKGKRVLRNAELFHDLNDIHLNLIMMICEEVTLGPQEIIFRQDDPGDALYIIAQGEVSIILETNEREPVQLALLEENDTFGETILIDKGTRSATARCHTEVQMLRIPRAQMLQLAGDYPEIGFHIMRRMATDLMKKLRSANLNIRTLTKNTP
ncbi:MAG TPA: cyclic nucleotide-binding domain-containing protein [Thermoflexia bacterium]|nr:cyclic nucleotide-binding domain-containing protein [Thermoflexia bacterium]